MTGSARGAGSDVPGARPRPTRRTVLGLTYAAALAAVSGCGVRLDLPEPPPPIPTRRLVPDEGLLVDLVRELEDLAAQASVVTRPGRSARTVETLAGLFAEQGRVVTGRLTNDGVPTEVIHPTPSVSPSAPASGASTAPAPGTAAPTTPAAKQAPSPVTLAAFAKRLVGMDTSDWTVAAAATPANRDLVVSVHSVRLAGAALLGTDLSFGSKASPARPLLVERTAPLVYGFEVVAAQSSDNARKRALAALDEAADLLHALGGTSPTAPGGWALPFPVTTAKEATRLAEHLLGTAIASLPTLAEAARDADSLEDIGRWSARVQAMGARWGLPLTPFPGMGA